MTHLDFHITGADVLRPHGFCQDALCVAGGHVIDAAVGRMINLCGYKVLPGIVDIHGDGFERHLAPRRGAMKDLKSGLISAESELAANGITTGILSQFYSWEGGLRGPEFATSVFSALSEMRGDVVTDLRAQLRFETHMLADYGAVLALVDRFEIGYVVFNDHVPHERIEAGRKPKRLTGTALKSGRSPEALLALMQSLHDVRDQVPEAISKLAHALNTRNVRIGSHDDRTIKQRVDWREMGVKIAEFPETVEAAEAAQLGGDGIILGAPNVARGGSHNGNVSAIDLVALGLCDALASDYHYPSLRRAAFFLAEVGIVDFATAWGMVSSGPARILGLCDRGELCTGKRADFVVLDADTNRLCATVSGGRISYLSGDVADRFFK